MKYLSTNVTWSYLYLYKITVLPHEKLIVEDKSIKKDLEGSCSETETIVTWL